MVMGLESSGIKVTGDSIKTKLLQDVTVNKARDSVALYSYRGKSESPQTRKGPRCFNCNKYGHMAKFCKKKSEPTKKAYQKSLLMACKLSSSEESDVFFLDSGATVHFCKDKVYLTDKVEKQMSVTIADGSKLSAGLAGNMDLPVRVNGNKSSGVMANLAVPER